MNWIELAVLFVATLTPGLAVCLIAVGRTPPRRYPSAFEVLTAMTIRMTAEMGERKRAEAMLSVLLTGQWR